MTIKIFDESEMQRLKSAFKTKLKKKNNKDYNHSSKTIT